MKGNNRNLYDQKIKTTIEQYTAGAGKFRKAKNSSEMYSALDNLRHIDPKDEELVQKAYKLVTDKKEHKNLRQRALSKLTRYLHNSEPAVKDMIGMLNDKEEPVEMKRSALKSLIAISFNSPALNAQMPHYKQALRSLLNSHDPELVRMAADKLAGYKDGSTQKILLDGLKDHTKALVPDEKAIQLLGRDTRAEHYLVIRNILSQSKNPAVQLECVTALSGDPESEKEINATLADKSTDEQVRIKCISALNSLKAEKYQGELKSMILDENESPNIRAAALNALSFHNNLASVYEDKDFNNVVENLKSVDNEGLRKMSNLYLTNKGNYKK
jgi:HEAT repeat protein